MMEGSKLEGIPSRREICLGWLLGFLCLTAFLACPNVKMPNGDALGWGGYLEQYALAEGTPFYPTESHSPGPRYDRLTEEELEQLGARQRQAGWWILWNPHHLLYLPVTATVFRLADHLFPGLEALTFLRGWNALFSALTILLIYFLLVKIVPGSPFPFPWCLFLATSVTYFRYATDGAQYPTSVLFLVVASGGTWAYVSNGQPKYLLRAGFWMALAVLFHQIVSIIVLFLLLGILFLFWGVKKKGVEISWSWFWWTVGIAMGLPILVYIAIGAIALGPTGEFNIPGLIKYATLYAHEQSYWTQSFWDGFYTNLVTFVGFYFGDIRTRTLFLQSIWFTALVIILPAFWLTAIVNIRRVSPVLRWWLMYCLLWVLPLLIFLSFWVPGHGFYHLFLTVPLGCLVVIGAESSRGTGVRGWCDILLFWVWCILAIAINLPQSLAGCSW